MPGLRGVEGTEREKVRKKKNGGRYCLQYKYYTVFGKKNRDKENDMWARCFFFFFLTPLD